MRHFSRTIGGFLCVATLGFSSLAIGQTSEAIDNPDNQAAASFSKISITGAADEKVALLVVDNHGKAMAEPYHLRVGPKGTLEVFLRMKDYEGINTGSRYMQLICKWVADPAFFDKRIEIKKSWDPKAGSAYGAGIKDKLFDNQKKEWKPGTGNELKITEITWSEEENDIAHAAPVGAVILKRGDGAWDGK